MDDQLRRIINELVRELERDARQAERFPTLRAQIRERQYGIRYALIQLAAIDPDRDLPRLPGAVSWWDRVEAATIPLS